MRIQCSFVLGKCLSYFFHLSFVLATVPETWGTFSFSLTEWLLNDFLETVVQGLPEDLPVTARQNLWLERDGAPLHYGKSLNTTYPGGWTGYGGPSRSPDVTQMDFFLWGHVKVHVYKGPSEEYRGTSGKTASSCGNGRSQHVKACSTEWRGEHCRLPWNGRKSLSIHVMNRRRPG